MSEVENKKLPHGQTCLRVTVPDSYEEPLSVAVINAAFDQAKERGATWIEIRHKGEQVMVIPVLSKEKLDMISFDEPVHLDLTGLSPPTDTKQ